ncbi:E3 SUMO-protein ligase ZBED1-like [Anopheles funestus]|uniref:E3 SUMO-protein ligase ZBED1-like n=1 Tax=Anopheles funestus TaxID=62324 RepID=UPI0020C5E924|nr:E3 SUMO-protein ligase ZBED1-like [Anopheles funestus]
MPPTTSDVWQHFERAQNTAECRYCHVVLSYRGGSTSNLKRHIERKHVTVPMNRTEALGNNVENSNNIPSATSGEYGGIHRYFASSRPLTAEVKRDLDETLLIMICKEYYPYSIVEDKYFKLFVKKLYPAYDLPSRKCLTNALLPTIYEKTLLSVKNNLIQAKAVSLTADGWSNVNQVSFFAITAHYIDENFQLRTYLLECSEFTTSHTAQNIAVWIKKVTEKFNIQNKIVCLVTDNASNMKKAASELELPHFSCFAHSLNLVVQDAIENSIKSTIDEVRRITTHFKHSALASQKLHEIQLNLKLPELKLKQDVATRWNSTFDMLERFLKNKIPLVSCLASLKFQSSLRDNDWLMMEQAISVLQFFDLATKEVMSERSVSLYKVGIIIRTLSFEMARAVEETNLRTEVAKLVRILDSNLRERFVNYNNTLVDEAIILDPRFKEKQFLGEKYDATIASLKQKLVPENSVQNEPLRANNEDKFKGLLWRKWRELESNRETTISEQTTAVVEIDRYLQEKAMNSMDDPLIWWKTKHSLYPQLYKIVQKTLCIPATSVPCERVFSKAGGIITEKRNKLLPKKLNEMLFIKQNL